MENTVDIKLAIPDDGPVSFAELETPATSPALAEPWRSIVISPDVLELFFETGVLPDHADDWTGVAANDLDIAALVALDE